LSGREWCCEAGENGSEECDSFPVGVHAASFVREMEESVSLFVLERQATQ